MRSLNRNDLPKYADVFEGYCGYCGKKYYYTVSTTVYHSDQCQQYFNSLIQRSDRAFEPSWYKLPIDRAWCLETKEKLLNHLERIIRSGHELYHIQDINLIKEAMSILGIERVSEDPWIRIGVDLFTPNVEELQDEIFDDAIKIVDYPPAFKNNKNRNEEILIFLLKC